VAFEDVVVVVPLPKAVKTTNLQANVGTVLYDEASKVGREGGREGGTEKRREQWRELDELKEAH